MAICCYRGDLLLSIVEHLKNVQICIWKILDGALVKQPQVYGEGARKTVNLLQTNVIVHIMTLELKQRHSQIGLAE